MPKLLFVFLLTTSLVGGQELQTITLPGTEVSFDLMALPGGTFAMGPDGKAVTLSPFAIGTHEVTHDAYRLFQRRDNDNQEAALKDFNADAINPPTPPKRDLNIGFGERGGVPQVKKTPQDPIGLIYLGLP
ncbi:MAG: hypothetical protein AAF840_06330, partial [Bacteroidota bacterium]